MATTESKPGEERTIVASWVPCTLADEIKQKAETERRSVSSVIRDAVEDQLRDEGHPQAADQDRKLRVLMSALLRQPGGFEC